MPTMNPKTWGRRDWCNFLAAVPAAFSLVTLAICGMILAIFWIVFSGYAIILAGLIVVFLATVVLTRAGMNSRL